MTLRNNLSIEPFFYAGSIRYRKESVHISSLVVSLFTFCPFFVYISSFFVYDGRLIPKVNSFEIQQFRFLNCGNRVLRFGSRVLLLRHRVLLLLAYLSKTLVTFLSGLSRIKVSVVFASSRHQMLLVGLCWSCLPHYTVQCLWLD